jgi:hypothetical protein
MQRQAPATRAVLARGVDPRHPAPPNHLARASTARARPTGQGAQAAPAARRGERRLPRKAARRAARRRIRTPILTVQRLRGASRDAMRRAAPTPGPRNAFHGGRTSRPAATPRGRPTPELGRTGVLVTVRPPGTVAPPARQRLRVPVNHGPTEVQLRPGAMRRAAAPRVADAPPRRALPRRMTATVPATWHRRVPLGRQGRRWTSTAGRAELPGPWQRVAISEKATLICRVAARLSIGAHRWLRGRKLATSRRMRRVDARRPTISCAHDLEPLSPHARPSITPPIPGLPMPAPREVRPPQRAVPPSGIPTGSPCPMTRRHLRVTRRREPAPW